MKHPNLVATLAVLAFGTLLLGSTPPAEAGGGWSVGGRFAVGPFDFNVYYQPGRYDHYYYRTSKPIHYRGVTCGDACYHRGGYDYHHASCPLVGFHFRRYGFHPARVLGPIFHPRGYGHYDSRHRSHGFRWHDGPYRPGPYGYRSYPPPTRHRGHGGHGPSCEYRGHDRYRDHRYDRDWDSDSDSDSDRYRRRGRDTRPYRYRRP